MSLFVLAQVAGCTTTADFRLPDNRFLSPENSGEAWSGNLSLLGYGSKTNVILARDIDPEFPSGLEVVDNAALRKDDGFYLGAGLSVARRVDLFSINGGNGIKFQWMGAPEAGAPAGNFSFSTAFGYDAGTLRNFKIVEDVFRYETSSRVKYEVIDMMVLTGYRLSQSSIVYANLARARFKGTGSIHHLQTSIGGSVYRDYTISSPERAGEQWSALAGFRAVDELGAFGAVELGLARTTMVGTKSLERPVFGVNTGVSW